MQTVTQKLRTLQTDSCTDRWWEVLEWKSKINGSNLLCNHKTCYKWDTNSHKYELPSLPFFFRCPLLVQHPLHLVWASFHWLLWYQYCCQQDRMNHRMSYYTHPGEDSQQTRSSQTNSLGTGKTCPAEKYTMESTENVLCSKTNNFLTNN